MTGMPPQPSRVTPDRMGEFLHTTPYALLRLDRSPRIELQRGVAEFFASAYPGQFTFGTLSRGDIRQPGWLEQVFKSSVGVLRAGVRDGYYLFHHGTVVGHHLGVISNVSYHGADMAKQNARVIQHAFAGVGMRPETVEATRQIVVYFDEIVARRQAAAGFEDRRYVREERESAPPPPRRAAPPPSPDDPFVLLGVSRDASDDEVRAAYKAQMKLNHPDKVAHLSPALQQFAQAQTIAIKKAYETIMEVRKR